MSLIYSNNWDSETTGQEPAGLTQLGTNNNYSVETNTTYGGSTKSLEITSSGTQHDGFYLDTGHTDGDGVTQAVFRSSNVGSSRFGVLVRGHVSVGDNKGYFAALRSGSSFRMGEIRNTAETVLQTDSISSISNDTWYWIRFQSVGTALKAMFWADGNVEPDQWEIELTDDSFNAGDETGVGAYGYIDSSTTVIMENLTFSDLTYTGPTVIGTPTTDETTSGTLTFSHTVPSGADVLIVRVGTHQGTISSVEFDGDALTLLEDDATAFNEIGAIYYLNNPTAKTGNIVVVRSGGSWTGAQATQYENCDTIGVGTISASDNGSSSHASVEVTPTVDNSLIISAVGTEATPTAYQTEDFALQNNSYENAAGSSYEQDIAQGKEVGFGLSSGQRWAMAVAVLEPAPSGTSVNDERGAKVTGSLSVNDERDATLTGKASANDGRSAKTTGQDSANDNRGAKVTGKGTANDTRGAKVVGKDTSNDERSAKTTGKVSTNDERSAKVIGKDTSSDSRGAKTTGKVTSNDTRSAKVTGRDSANDERPAKVTGKDTATDERGAKTTGITGSNDERSAKTFGKDTANDERLARVVGKETTSDTRSAKTVGITGANDERNAKVTGVDTTSDERLAKVVGSQTAQDSRSATLSGQSSSSSQIDAKTTGKQTTSSQRGAKLTGVATANDEIDAKTSGKDSSSDERSAKVVGKQSTNDSRNAKLTGVGTASSQRGARLTGINRSNDERNAKLVGIQTVTDERGAKTSGKSTASSERGSKVTGKTGASSQRNAHLYGKYDYKNDNSDKNWRTKNNETIKTDNSDSWKTRNSEAIKTDGSERWHIKLD